MRVAFDVDNTIIKKNENGLDVPCYPVLNLLIALQAVGVEVYLWSGGGLEYVNHWKEKLGLDVKILIKEKTDFIDVCFDDQEVDLAKINVKLLE